eukprot:Skav224698  [mRNA]  locus=scaffold699:93144:94120:- [translate_table: standard]
MSYNSLCHLPGPQVIWRCRAALESIAPHPHPVQALQGKLMQPQKRQRQQQQPNGLCLLPHSLKALVVFEGPHVADEFVLRLRWESEAPDHLEAFGMRPRSTPS